MVGLRLLPTLTKRNSRERESRPRERVFRHRLPGKIQMNLKHFKMSDLEDIACELSRDKDCNITTLRLFCSSPDFEILRFPLTDPTTSHILMRFSRFSTVTPGERFLKAIQSSMFEGHNTLNGQCLEVAQAMGFGGWLKHLEVGFKLWKRDLRVLSPAIGVSTTLQRLSFANSTFGDDGLQLLAQGISNCSSLQILNLSGCALSDSSHVSLSSILKASVGLKAEAEWQSSLRECESGKAKTTIPRGLALHRGLSALDLSFNFLSDATAKHISSVMRLGAPLEALNLQGNQMQRKSMKLFLSVFEMWGILKFVDLRDNLDRKVVGVLEYGEHLSFFSAAHEPFWKSNSHVDVGGQSLRSSLASRLPKKESSTNSKYKYPSGFEESDEANVENRVVLDKRTDPTSEGKQISTTRALALSPLFDEDTESADLIHMNILPWPTCRTEDCELPYVLSSRNTHLDIASRPLSPPEYLPNPLSYSDYLYLCEAPDPDLTSFSCSSRDDAHLTGLSFSVKSPSYTLHDQGMDQHIPATEQMNITQYEPMDPLPSGGTPSESERAFTNHGEGLYEKQTYANSRQLRAPSPETTHEDSEWEAFIGDMARKLLHLQDGLETVISSAKPDFLIAAQTAMTSLQEGLQQLLPL